MRGSKEGSSDDIEIIEIKETKGNKPKPKSKSKSKYLNMDGHADLSSMSSSCEDTDNETLAKKVLKIQFEGVIFVKNATNSRLQVKATTDLMLISVIL